MKWSVLHLNTWVYMSNFQHLLFPLPVHTAKLKVPFPSMGGHTKAGTPLSELGSRFSCLPKFWTCWGIGVFDHVAQLGRSLRYRQPCSAPIEHAWAECWCHLGPWPLEAGWQVKLCHIPLLACPVSCSETRQQAHKQTSSVSFWAGSAAWLASRTGQRMERVPLWVLSEQNYEYITRAGAKSRPVMMNMSCLDRLVYDGPQHERWMLVV